MAFSLPTHQKALSKEKRSRKEVLGGGDTIQYSRYKIACFFLLLPFFRCGDTNFPVKEDNCVPSRISVLLLSAHLKVTLLFEDQILTSGALLGVLSQELRAFFLPDYNLCFIQYVLILMRSVTDPFSVSEERIWVWWAGSPSIDFPLLGT